MDFKNIRPMELPDLEQVTVLARQLGYPNEVEEIEDRFNELARRSEHSLYVYAIEDEVLGWIYLYQDFGLLLSAKAEIKALVVDENARNRGIGKALLDFAKTWAKMNSLNTIIVRTSILREKAHAFYQREGFDLQKTSHLFSAKI